MRLFNFGASSAQHPSVATLNVKITLNVKKIYIKGGYLTLNVKKFTLRGDA